MTNLVQFPGLGLSFHLNRVAFTIGGVSIYWYGVCIAVGLCLALIFAFRHSLEFGVDPDSMVDVILIGVVLGIISARAYYVAMAPFKYESIWEMIAIRDGGLAIYGGIIGGFLFGGLACKWRGVPVLPMFDLTAMGFLIGQGCGRWGNFFNQEAFGGNTDLPWGMTGNLIQAGGNGSGYDTMEPVHPTFLYESLWCLLGLLVLHLVSKKMYKFKGEIFALYIMWYGAGRAVIEGLRTDSLMLGTIRVSQLLAILSVFGGLILFFVFRRHAQQLPKDLFAEEAATIPGLEGVLAEGEEAGEPDQPEEADASEETGSTEPAAQAETASEESADWKEETQTDTDPSDGKEDENKAEK